MLQKQKIKKKNNIFMISLCTLFCYAYVHFLEKVTYIVKQMVGKLTCQGETAMDCKVAKKFRQSMQQQKMLINIHGKIYKSSLVGLQEHKDSFLKLQFPKDEPSMALSIKKQFPKS